jgi:hypothetical protein
MSWLGGTVAFFFTSSTGTQRVGRGKSMFEQACVGMALSPFFALLRQGKHGERGRNGEERWEDALGAVSCSGVLWAGVKKVRGGGLQYSGRPLQGHTSFVFSFLFFFRGEDVHDGSIIPKLENAWEGGRRRWR